MELRNKALRSAATPAPTGQESRSPEEPQSCVPGKTMHAGQMLAVALITLLLAALFNADALVRDSQSKPYGENRDFWLSVWRPFQNVSDALLLDQPRAALDQATGREPRSAPSFDFPALVDSAEASTDPPPAAFVAPSPTSLPSPTPEPTVRPPTPSEPLRLWVGGDSLAGIFGQSLVRMASDTGLIDATLDYRVATGLSRPDYFNWPAQLQQVMENEDPDVMVLVFGSNDSQGLITPQGDVFQPMSDGWRAEYRRRVAGTMDLLARPGRLIVWIGLPPMRDGDFSQRLADIDRIYREEASARPGKVEYVDATAVLGDAGAYASYLDDGAGHVQLVREPDGVHLTRAGGDRLAGAVMYQLAGIVPLSQSARARP